MKNSQSVSRIDIELNISECNLLPRPWLAVNLPSSANRSTLACVSLAFGTDAKEKRFLLKGVL